MQHTEKKFGCGSFSVVGPIKGQPGKFGYKRLFCGSYRCNRCRKPKLKKVRERISQIAAEHKLQRMVTLTLDPKKIPAEHRKTTDRYIRGLWRMMRVLLSRDYGKNKSLPFVGVLEFQKNGNAHLHVLIGQYIPQAWLSNAWQSIGGGQFVDIRFVDVHRVAAYLSVYLTGDKVLHTLALLPKRARIFTTSRSIVLWGKKKPSGWRLRRVDIGELFDAVENKENVRFSPVDDLRVFKLELLSYFESPPCRIALGVDDVIAGLRKALPFWNEKKVSPEQSGDARKTETPMWKAGTS